MKPIVKDGIIPVTNIEEVHNELNLRVLNIGSSAVDYTAYMERHRKDKISVILVDNTRTRGKARKKMLATVIDIPLPQLHERGQWLCALDQPDNGSETVFSAHWVSLASNAA